MTLTIESGTALRNLIAAPAGAEAQQEGAAQGGAAAQTPRRDGAARPSAKSVGEGPRISATVAGQRQQRQRPNPATRPKETEGGGREGDKRRRRA